MGFCGVFSSLLHYMLPRRRPGEGLVVVEEEETNTNNRNGNSSAATSSIKKQRIGHFVADSTVNNCSLTSSNIIENDVPIMALGDSNPSDIDEDLHSRQLAVYGRETMRGLFASNDLISGIQGLGAEIAKNLVLAGVRSVTYGIYAVVLYFLNMMLVRTGHLLLFKNCRNSTMLLLSIP